jgi:cyanate lyase
MADVRTELLEAMAAMGLTYASLKEKSGVDCDLPALGRKLTGKTGLTLDEGCRIARVLGVRTKELDRLAALAASLGVSAKWEQINPRSAA